MLLSFSVQNYKSFVDKATLSMEAAPKQKDLDYSVKRVTIGRNKYSILSTAIIYGPNAAGKTTLIGALNSIRAIVLRGNIKDAPNEGSPDKASFRLSLIPNRDVSEPAPVAFAIRFIEEGKVFDYKLEMNLGAFLDDSFQRHVVSERLSINDKEVFVRERNEIQLFNLSFLESWLIQGLGGNEEAIAQIAGNALDEDLFVANGFKTLVSTQLSSEFTNWFATKLDVAYRANDIVFNVKTLPDIPDQTALVVNSINEAAHEFGMRSNAIGYLMPEDGNEPALYTLFPINEEKGAGRALLADHYESLGTIRFANLFPLVLNALVYGRTLVVDEFDSSIHPMAIISIINLFHNDEINLKGAQLIFDTHNPIFLNAGVLRRDEIKFVERDEKTGRSEHYSLADFGTSGPSGVRSGEDYMKNYFVSKYGAINDIDFTPLFKRLVLDSANDDNGGENA